MDNIFKIDLLKGSIWKGLLLFAIPLLISNVFQQLYNTVDTVIVGNILGESSLAAMGACSSIYDLITSFVFGIGNGFGIVAARCFGSKKKNDIKNIVASSLIIGIILSGIIIIICRIYMFSFLKVINTPDNIINESYSYISLITLFVFIMFAYNLCSSFMRAIGNSWISLFFLVISSVLNIILDYVFIVYLGIGIKGAAYGTIIAESVSVILCLIYIKKNCELLVLHKENFIINKNIYKELIGQGFSMGMMMSVVSIGTLILQSSINSMGYLIIAGHTAARKISTFAVIPCSTVSSSLSTFVSQNKGANKYNRIKKAVKYCNYIMILWGILATIFMLFFSNVIIKVVSGSENIVIIENGSNYLKINAPFYIVLGILLNMRNSLQGMGHKIIPLISSFIECIGKILFVFIFIPILNYYGVIICEPLIWCVMCLQLSIGFVNDKNIRI